MRLHQPLVAAAAAACCCGGAAAQQPDALWRFEDADKLGTDTQGTFELSLGPDGVGSHGTRDGCVGGYLEANGSAVHLSVSAATASPYPAAASPGLTVEFLFRLPRLGNFNKAGNTTVLSSGGGQGDAGWGVAFDRHSLRFRAAGRVVEAQLVGSGVRSIWNLADGKWHHLACRIDATTGEQSIWVDGECPDVHGGSSPANTSTAPGTVPAGVGVLTVLPVAFDGAVDEIAVYTKALTNGTIYGHYKTAVKSHQPYTFDAVHAPAPPPGPAAGAYNLSDFHPGTALPTPAGNSSNAKSVLTLPIDQLKAFPDPRYLDKPASGPAIGTPQKLFNWMDPHYMAGSAYKYFAPVGTLLNVSEEAIPKLQAELASTWHYNLNFMRLGTAACAAGKPTKADPNPTPVCKEQQMIDLSNAHPEWGVDTIFQRAGAKVCADYSNKSTCEKSWRFKNQTLPDGCYLQDKAGKFLTLTGAQVNASDPRSLKVLRPTTAAGATKNGCEDAIFSEEWQGYRTHGQMQKVGGWKGKVSRINNDGENSEIYMIAATLEPCPFDSDPTMLDDYKRSDPAIPPLGNGKPDWLSFVSRWRARHSNQLVEKLTSDKESPELDAAAFSEYEIQGTSLFFGEWNETRKVNTPVTTGGKERYYSTGDFYPWWNVNRKGPTTEKCHTVRNVTTCVNVTAELEYGTPSWDVSHGANRGVDWLAQMLPSQIATGDTLWSPFVAAGWSEQEELNTRPAQWLGFLKLLAVTGAEWYYTGFFNLHPAFPDPRNWVWQGAAPSYAQAITSHYLDVLFEGELLAGDMPLPPIEDCFVVGPGTDPMQWVTVQGMGNCTLPDNRQPYKSYRFWAGSQAVAVFVRALPDQSKYVVAGTVQPTSNTETSAPFSVTVNVTLPFGDATLEMRRQGSVYILTKPTVAADTGVDTWTVVQLDKWHESSHFSRWSTALHFEAELHDDHAAATPTAVESAIPLPRTELATAASHWLDFSSATTFVPLRDGKSLAYTVKPRPLSVNVSTGLIHAETESRRYTLKVRARAADSDHVASTLSIAQGPDITSATSVGTIHVREGRWGEHVMSAQLELSTGHASKFWVSAVDGAADLDWVVLSEDLADR